MSGGTSIAEDIQAMTVPLFRSLAAPSRKVSVTGPWVVGVHVTVEAWPAVTMNELSTVNGFSVD